MALKWKVRMAGLVAMGALWAGAASLQAQAPAVAEEKAPAFLPMGDMRNARNIRAVVKEEKDQEFKVTVRGTVGEGGAPLVVKGSDGAVISSTTVPEGTHDPFEVTVPQDGKAGEYVILIATRDGKENLTGPLTTLPKEVYVMSYWIQARPMRFYTRSKGQEPESVQITPHKSRGKIETAEGKVLAETAKGEALQTSIGPEGAWIDTLARYVDAEKPVVLALSPEAWFAPSDTAAQMKP